MLARASRPALDATDFSIAGVDAALRGFAEETGRKLGQVAQPLRAALTGSTMSPPIDATLAALGRAESLARIAAVLAIEFFGSFFQKRTGRQRFFLKKEAKTFCTIGA